MGRILPALLFIVVFFFQDASVSGQGDYSIHHYTNENGLPANGVKAIELDQKTGFLWVGTQAGLVRFDGSYFESFNLSKRNIAASRITLMSQNREGTIYCEDDNFSIYRIKDNRPEFEMTDTLFYPFHQSKRWQTLYKSIARLKEILINYNRSSFLPNWIVFHDESGDSSSFSFTHLDCAYHYSATEDSLFAFPGFTNILKIGAKVYFVDANLGVWQYNENFKKLLQVRINGVPEWKRKNNEMPRLIWKVGMKDPLFLWNQSIWKLQDGDSALQMSPVCSSCTPPNADISCVQVWEEQGVIFLGSAVNGLYVIKAAFLRTIRADTTIEAGQAEYAQAEISPGVIATGSGLLFSGKGKLLPDKKNIRFNPKTVYQDQHSDQWTHSRDTIIHYHRQEGRYTRISINDGAEKMVFAESGGRLFVFSDIGIGEITGDRYNQLYKLPYVPGQSKNWLNPDAVAELRPGLFAIASEKLLLFDTKRSVAPDTVAIPGLTTKVRSLLKYRGYMFIGTYGQGFYLYKDGVVKKMPLDKNGYLNYAHCFMPDDKGFCWISSNHGLFRVSLNALIAAYESDLDEIYYHYFGKNDGLFNTELNGGCQPCALKLSDGLYSFPSMNGVVVFDPHQDHAPPPSGKIFIDEVYADTVSYSLDNGTMLMFPYDIRNLRFKFSLPEFGNQENIYFSYKLEPYNTKWETQDIIRNNVLQFGRLKPGNYTLQLRVRNGFEPNQFALTVVKFRVLEPWYQAWWFFLLCFSAVAAMIWVLVKWRTARLTRRKEQLQHLVTEQTENIAMQSRQLEDQLQQLQRQQTKLEEDNRIKARLIAIISHDILSPLKFLGFMSRKLRDTFLPADPAHTTASSITTVTQDLESLSVNMLNWIRFHYEADNMQPEQFNLYDLINESTEIVSALASEKGLKLHNDVPLTAYVLQDRQALGVIVYNLAMNAMKYTQTGEIRISGRFAGNNFSLIVRDTGEGMPEELVDRLNNEESFIPDYSVGQIKKFQFGYRIIKDLLRLLHAKMNVESTMGKGTQVTLEFRSQEGSNATDT